MNFNFNENYILEDERVLLRPLVKYDFDNLLHFSMEEPEIWKYSHMQPIGEKGLKEYISFALNTREKKLEYPFIVFDKRTNAYAGSTRFYDIQFQNKTLLLGYTWYGKNFQGTGLNKHCKYLLLEFAFEKMGAERVELRADNENDRSIAAMKSIGCKPEGIMRSHSIRADGTRRDCIVLSILKSEWESEVREMLRRKLG